VPDRSLNIGWTDSTLPTRSLNPPLHSLSPLRVINMDIQSVCFRNTDGTYACADNWAEILFRGAGCLFALQYCRVWVTFLHKTRLSSPEILAAQEDRLALIEKRLKLLEQAKTFSPKEIPSETQKAVVNLSTNIRAMHIDLLAFKMGHAALKARVEQSGISWLAGYAPLTKELWQILEDVVALNKDIAGLVKNVDSQTMQKGLQVFEEWLKERDAKVLEQTRLVLSCRQEFVNNPEPLEMARTSLEGPIYDPNASQRV